MRVLHITYDMRIGGTEMVIKNIIEGRNSSHVDMAIFCIEEPLGPWGESLKSSGVDIVSQARQPGFDRTLISTIRRYIKSNNIDVVHCHQYTPWVYGTLAATFTDAAVVFTEHGRFYPDSTSWKRRLVNPILLALTQSVTAISEATKQALVDFEYIPKSNVSVVYNGIKGLVRNTAKEKITRDALSIPQDAFVLGTIARFDPIKNHSMMLKAFSIAKMSNPHLILIMVGDGEERENIENTINELNLSNSVILTGYKPTPIDYLSIFDVFLLSSLSEGTSMTLLESLSLGIPCVVTDAGGNAEIITHEQNGLVTPNDDADAFANAINTIATKNLSSFRENAQKTFQERFTCEHMLSSYTALYSKIKGRSL